MRGSLQAKFKIVHDLDRHPHCQGRMSCLGVEFLEKWAGLQQRQVFDGDAAGEKHPSRGHQGQRHIAGEGAEGRKKQFHGPTRIALGIIRRLSCDRSGWVCRP